uniref:Uncharacterized protein n=1 Tax=Anguilla anguilla TaxID=7936 RepID=A0A0E9WJD3_ANGAN
MGLNILKLAYSRTVYKLPSKVCRPCIMAKITVFWPKQYSLFLHYTVVSEITTIWELTDYHQQPSQKQISLGQIYTTVYSEKY